MQYKTPKELLSCKAIDSAPYPTTMVRVCVIKVGHTATFNSSNGEKGQMLNFSAPDATEAMTATLSDETKFPFGSIQTDKDNGRTNGYRSKRTLFEGNRPHYSTVTKEESKRNS